MHDLVAQGHYFECGCKPTQSRMISRQKIFFLIRLAVTLGLVAYIGSRIDVRQLIERIHGMKLEWIAPVLLALMAQVIFAALRWQRIISALHQVIGFRRALGYTWEGVFFGQMLPSVVGGDVVRMWRIYKDGIPGRVAASTVVLDRLCALGTVILAVLIALPLLAKLVRLPHFVPVLLGLAIVAILGIAFLAQLDRLVPLSPVWRITHVIHRLSRDCRALLSMPASAGIAVVYSLFVIGLYGISLYFLGCSLDIQLGLPEALAFTPLIMLIIVLPISLAGWGVREVGMAALLPYAGIEPTDAVTLSILLGLGTLIASVPGGVLWLARPDPALTREDVPDFETDADSEKPEHT